MMGDIKLTRRGWWAAAAVLAVFWLMVAVPIFIAVKPLVPECLLEALQFGAAMWTTVIVAIGVVGAIRVLDPFFGKGPFWEERR